MIWFEILIILVLVLLNGFFSMSELAVLSARKSQLKRQADSGAEDAQTVLGFLDESEPFLAAIQIGITLIGILTGVFGGATLAEELGRVFGHYMRPGLSQALSMGIVVVLITFLTLVFGELVPKQLALHHPERIARRVALPIRWLSLIVSPLVRLLSASTKGIMGLLALSDSSKESINPEDLIELLKEGHEAGSLSAESHQIMQRALELEEVTIGSLMTPRRRLVCLDLNSQTDQLAQIVLRHLHSCYPVYAGDPENLLGIVFLKDILPLLVSQQPVYLSANIQEALYLPDSITVSSALKKFRQHGCHEALVFDPHSQVQGMIRLSDLLLSLSPSRHTSVMVPERLPGELSLMLFCERFSCRQAAHDLPIHVHTLAGLVLYLAEDIPKVNDSFEWAGLNLKVLELEGPRISRIQVTPAA